MVEASYWTRVLARLSKLSKLASKLRLQLGDLGLQSIDKLLWVSGCRRRACVYCHE